MTARAPDHATLGLPVGPRRRRKALPAVAPAPRAAPPSACLGCGRADLPVDAAGLCPGCGAPARLGAYWGRGKARR